MTIRFKMRKYDRCFDSSYSHFEGGKLTFPDWHVGDQVDVMFSATDEQAKAVESVGRDGFAVWKGMAHIPCIVLKRYHSVVWKSIGHLEANSFSVTLQATDGYWEDLLAWIIIGRRPEWADETE